MDEHRKATAGVPQGSILGPLLFLVYINALSGDLSSKAKLFADDTSLFSVTHDITTSKNEVNNDLKKISDWAFQWKVSFNPDPSKQAQEEHYKSILNKTNRTIGPLRKLQSLLPRAA